MSAPTSEFNSQYLDILDALDAVVYVADMETFEILFLNRLARETSGGSIGDICWEALQKDQDKPCPFCTNHRLLDENGNPTEPYVWEIQNTVNGEWWECRDQAIYWSDGRLARLEIATNITRRKQLEEEREKTISDFEEAQKLAKIGNWELDLRTDELQWSKEVFRIFGICQESFEGTYKDFLNAIHPDDRKRVLNTYEDSVKDRTVYDIVHRVKMDDGSIKHVREKCETFYVEDGTPTRSIGTVQDITALQRKELELSEERQRLKLALQGANSGMWDWDLRSNAVRFDANYYTMAGYEPFEFPQTFEEWEKHVHADDLVSVKRTIEKTLARHDDRFTAEFRFKHKDGNWVWFFAQGNIVEWDANNNPVRFIGLHTDIDAIKKVESALRDSEERLEMALAGAELGSWDWYPQTGKTIFNDRWAEMLGYRLDEIEPHVDSWSDLLHPDDLPLAEKVLYDHVEGRTPLYQTEFRMKTKQGDWKWILDTGKVSQWDEDGCASRVTGTHQDITERKLMESRLKQSEQRYRGFFENSLVGIFQSTPEGNFITVNQAFADMLGYATPQELVDSINDIGEQCYVNQEDRNRYQHVINEKGVAAGILHQFKRKDGSSLWIMTHSRKMKGSHGVYYEGVVIDISEQKRAQEALRTSEENLRITLNSIGDAVISTDSQQNIVHMNPVAEKLTGWTEEQARGRELTDIFKIVSAQTREKAANPVDEVLTTGQVVTLANHTILVSQSGQEYQIADSAAPILDKYGEMTGAVLVFRDVTEEYRIRDELQKMQQLESIGTLAGGIAHDFNNILSGIFGNIELAKLKTDSAHQGRKYLDQAEDSIDRARKLTGQLLTFAKGGEPIRDDVSLGELIEEVAAFDLSGSPVKLEFKQSDDIWWADVDRGQIQQAISNLVINAIQSMPNGGFLDITLDNHRLTQATSPDLKPGKYLRIRVTDQGKGIAEKDLRKIFDPYFSTKKNGQGLGLTTVYSIIKRHEGHIDVQSHPDRGTTFTLFLPASDKTVHHQPTIPSKPGEPEKGLKILLMDDEEIILDLTREMLSCLEAQTDLARHGEEVLSMYSTAQQNGATYDLVILDLTIPGGMGGKETMEKLAAVDPKVNAIVSSGYADDPIMAQYRSFGFKGVITKPYTYSELKRTIEQLFPHMKTTS